MITATDIGKLIQNPISVSNYNPKELEEIRNKYPYCATLHLLYLKSISLTNDLQFEDHLRFSAAHIIDREQMYYLIHSGEKEPVKTEVFSTGAEAVSTKPENSETISKQAADAISENEPVVESDKAVTENVPYEIQEETKSAVSEAEKEIADEISSTKQLLESAPDLVDLAYESDLADESKITSDHSESGIQDNETKPAEQEEFEADVIESVEPVIVAEKPVDLSNLSFVEWLKYKQGKTFTAISSEEKVEGPQEQTESVTPQKNDTKVDEIKKAKKSGLSRFDVDALLNKFIKEEPSISRPQADFYNPVKNARQSVEESPDLVTETLAKIYVLQKNYTKAIQAYEQLSLVYPEKKTFFASQIKKIKEEQHKQSKQ